MDYIPDLSLMKDARPAHHVGVEALSPVMIKRLEASLCSTVYASFLVSAHHSGLQLHFSKAATSMHKGIYYDTIFILNTGRITSIGPHGEINWQVLTLCVCCVCVVFVCACVHVCVCVYVCVCVCVCV